MKKNVFRSTLIILITLLAVLFCRWELLPYVQKIPTDFSYSANVFSVDNFYDERERRFSGEILSVTKFSYSTIKKDEQGDLLIQNIFEVRKPSGKKIFSVERLYGINPYTGNHINGKGDRNRSGFLFAPMNIRDKEDFVYWHINYDTPALMKFQGEEIIAGLKVYRYASSYRADQTNNLTFLPGVPKERGVELDVSLQTWIDPVTGWLIKYEDHTEAWYYDIHTQQRLYPWNKFHNEFAQSSILKQVDEAKSKQLRITSVKIYIPLILITIAFIILSFKWFRKRYKKELLPLITSFVIFLTISGISLWFYNSHKNLEQEKYLEQFEGEAGKSLSYIKSELEECHSALDILRYNYQATGSISRNHFAQLSHHLLIRSDNMQAWGYAPIVKYNEREKFEQQVRAEGFPDFQFTEKGDKETLVRAGKRGVYLPIYFIEPLQGNERAIGFDALSDTSRQNALALSKRTGEMTTTEPIPLVQIKEPHKLGIVIFNPVFKKNEQGELELSAFFSGVYLLDNLITSAISSHDVNRDLKLKIFDVTSSKKQFIFSSPAAIFGNDLKINKRFPVLNRIWEFSFYLPPVTPDVNGIALLIVGIMFAFITSVLAFITLGNKTKELKESNERFFTIFDNNPIGMAITNLETDRFQFVNELFLRTIGYGKNEVIGKTSTEINIINPMIRKKMLDRLKQKKELKNSELLIQKKNGDMFWALSSAQVLTINNQQFLLASFHDISARKKIESALNQSKELFFNLFNHNPAAISIRRIHDDKIIDVNKSYLELFGFTSREEVVDKTIPESSIFIDPKQPQEIKELLEKNKFVKDYEVEVKTMKGEIRWLSASAVIIEIDHLPCILKVSIDVTERKQIVNELRSAKQTAEAAVVLKETFLANMSHEIRTPMNAIIGFTDLLLKRNLPAQEKDFIQTIKSSGENLLRIINDILDISKINSGTMTFEEHPISINELLDSLHTMLSPKVKNKNLNLDFICDKNIPDCLLGDPTRLTQILLNLIGNAVKFTKEGGIQVSAKVLKQEKETCYLEFSVKDTGIGIADDKLKLIFERFSQAESHTTRTYGGTGLGLDIAKQLVILQGGTIEVKSKLQEGSVFTFILPFKKTDKIIRYDHNHHDESKISELNKLTILLVEDNPINVKFVLSLFADYNIHAAVAENGYLAIEMVKTTDYDLILMDIEMPKMNGFEATEIIRTELKKDVPIIALTAHAMAGEEEKCLSMGMNGYISKPINATLLFEKMLNTTSAKKPVNGRNNHKPLVNLDFLIQSLNGKKDVIRETIDLFLEHVPEDLSLTNEAVAKIDYTVIKGCAHKLKSSVSLMGIEDATLVLEEMEQLGKAKENPERIKLLNQSLNQLCEKAIHEIRIERVKYE